MRQLSAQDLEDIVYGAAFLASGGGGPLSMGLELAKLIAEPVQLINVEEVGADTWGAVAAGMGTKKAPPSQRKAYQSVLRQNRSANPLGDSIQILIETFELLETTLNKKFSYILPIETGAVNTLAPIAVAAQKKIPVVDGDGAGKAVPKLELTTYAASGIPVSPLTLSNLRSATDEEIKTVLYANTPSLMEQLARNILSTEEFGNEAAIATHAMDGKTLQAKKPIIANTISRALEVGTTLRQAREGRKDPVKALLNFLNDSSRSKSQCAFELFRGTIELVEERIEEGFTWGSLTLKNAQDTVHVMYQNENLIAWRDNKSNPMAIAPDSICYLKPDGTPLSIADNLTQGDELVLIGLKAPEALRQNAQVFQKVLAGLGYGGSYVPIEQLQDTYKQSKS
jgi:DUF917 family protein